MYLYSSLYYQLDTLYILHLLPCRDRGLCQLSNKQLKPDSVQVYQHVSLSPPEQARLSRLIIMQSHDANDICP